MVNVKLMKDEKTAAEIRAKAEKLITYAEKADKVYEKILKRLNDK